MRYINENIENRNLGRILDQDESARRKMIVEAWKGTGYLHGLKGRDAANMAVLFENQKRQILKENTTTADMAVFDTIAIPMIRRQNALMVTPNLVSVQPLSYPHGMVFFLDYKVSTTKNPFHSDYLGNTGVGTDGTTPQNGNTFQTVSGYDQFYNNANYDVSRGRRIPRGWNVAGNSGGGAWVTADSGNAAAFTKAGVDLGAAQDVTDPDNIIPAQQKTAIIDFNLSGITGIRLKDLSSIQVYNTNVGATANGTLVEGTDYFVQRVVQNYAVDNLSTGIPTNPFDNPATTDVNEATSSEFGGFGGPNGGVGAWNLNGGYGNNYTVRLRIVPARAGLGTQTFVLGFSDYLDLELYPAFSSELKVQISRQSIDTDIHKLKTGWTVEFATDLMTYYAIDAEAELSQLLAEQIASEKDRLIIRELVMGAGHQEIWNADFRNAVDPNPANTVFRGIEADYNQGLAYAINAIDGKIRKSTRIGGANWVLISTEGYTKLVNMQTFKPTDIKDDSNVFAGGVEKVGTIEHKYTVYVDPFLPANVCLVGRKGTSLFDTGFVYAPYVEYMLSPTVIEDQDFNPRKMISSRFGYKMLNNKFFGVVVLNGIETFEVFQPATT